MCIPRMQGAHDVSVWVNAWFVVPTVLSVYRYTLALLSHT